MAPGRLPRIVLANLLLVTGLASITPLPVEARTHRAAVLQGPRIAPEDPAVRAPIEAYLRGHVSGDAVALRRVFWKEARLWWVRDGLVATRTIDEYVADVSAKPTSGLDHRRRLMSLEVTGDLASATLVIEYPTMRMTDRLTLLRIGDEWRIISKTFYAEAIATVI